MGGVSKQCEKEPSSRMARISLSPLERRKAKAIDMTIIAPLHDGFLKKFNELTTSDLAVFATIGVGPQLLAKAGIQRVTDQQARDVLALNGKSGDMAGIYFPYLSPLTGRRVTARVRRDNPEIKDGREKNKYMSAYGDRRHVYTVPGSEELINAADVPIILVEGEKSTLALSEWRRRTGQRFFPIGLGGDWGWSGTIGKAENAKGHRVDEKGLLSELREWCANRRVYILFDTDCATNPNVSAARRKLAAALRKIKADVRLLNLPALEGVNGPDDFIGIKGDQALLDLLAAGPTVTPLLTEGDLAWRFVELYEKDSLYIAAWKRWMLYSKVWQEDGTRKVFARARDISQEASLACEAEKDKAEIRWSRRASTVTGILTMANSDQRIAAIPDKFDTDLWFFNTPSGTVDLKNGSLREHRATDYITKIAGAGPEGECPLWRGFLHRVTDGDVEFQRYLQRVIGYCLTGDVREDKLFFLYGTGSNGKTTFTNTLLGIWADYAQVAAIETFTETKSDRHPTEMAAVRGARLVVASETEVGRRWSESRIKELTGHSPVRARFMHCDEFEYMPQLKLMIQGNHKPSLRSVDEAIRRRFHLIPFTVIIPEAERDKSFGEKLRAEWSGILRWAIEGCLEWQRIGLKPPPAVIDATEEYLATEDAIGRWREERTLTSPQAIGSSSTILFADFKAYAEAAGESAGTQKNFSQELMNRGLKIRHTNRGRIVEQLMLAVNKNGGNDE